MDEVGLGKRLQQARRDAGLTQQELCSKANLSYSTLAKIERGAIKSPSIFTIQSIAEALNSSLDNLLGLSTPSVAKKTSTSGVRFVYFDLNDTLVRLHASAYTQLARESGHSVDVVESVYWKYNEAVNKGDVSLKELNQAWSERLGITVDWQQSYLAAVDQMPGMFQLITDIAESYHVGILSNTCPGFIDALIEAGVVPRLRYDAIIDSSVVHAVKPEPEIYEIATTRAGVASNELMLIDDTRPNLVAAEAAGWHSLWFDAYNPEESVHSIRETLA